MFLSMSALDIMAMAAGTFVLLVVLLMPYYHKTFDAGDRLHDVRAAAAERMARQEAADRQATRADDEAARIEAETAAAERAIAAARAATTSLRRQAAAARARAVSPPPAVEPQRAGDTAVIRELDLVFVVDASGSMAGVIRELNLSLAGIVKVLERLIPSLRIGFVVYRDYDVDGEVTRAMPLTSTVDRLPELLGFARRIETARVGGATVTEAMLAGLQRALDLGLRPGAKQTLIVIGDAAAHPHEEAEALALARRLAAGGPNRTVSTLFVTTQSYLRYGRGAREFFMRLADAGGGAFSDHRGELMESILMSVLTE
jgi:Mg-chelatase subunit ChlD